MNRAQKFERAILPESVRLCSGSLMIRHLLTVVFLSLCTLPASILGEPAAGQALEAGANQATEIQGEVIQLELEDGPFTAIHLRHQRGEGRGGIVLLHDQGSSADSYEVIRPLRLGLARSGWDTLALELPAAHRSEKASDWRSRQSVIQARLQAGLDWLTGRGQTTRVVIAMGDTGSIALEIASAVPPGELQAMVLVSTAIEPGDTAALAALEKLKLPILDIHAERDRTAVVATAATRRAAAEKGGNQGYRQRTLPGSTAGFHRQEAALVAEIRAWLAATAGPPGIGN